MDEQKITDSEKYQQEIAEQYKKRVSKFSSNEILEVLRMLGITGVEQESIQEAVAGNMNATYLTPSLVIKINKDKEVRKYLANKIVSDKLSEQYPVVKVRDYDFFQKTNYEILIMERASGTPLLDDIFELSDESQIDLFTQVLAVVKQLFTIGFDNFGPVGSEIGLFPAYAELLASEFGRHIRAIREQKLCDEKDIEKVEKYFLENVVIFNDEKPVFIHTDLHMGNILHEGDRLTAIIDFDSALQAPKTRTLVSLLGFVDNPAQFVEGTKDFQKYKGKSFYHFLPALREGLSDVFNDRLLLKKLNMYGVSIGMMWIAGNWSSDWNKEMIHNIVDNELADSEEKLRQSYFGKILGH
jgi:hypothetical protein